MVKQGDIIYVSRDPVRGHEQSGKRPALVISNHSFNRLSNLAIVCPITNTNKQFPLHIPLDNRLRTTGVILCEHVRTLDINSRGYEVKEELPQDLLDRVLMIVKNEF